MSCTAYKGASACVQAIDSAEATAIDDVEDDLSRELAFYNQVSRGADCTSAVVACSACSFSSAASQSPCDLELYSA